MSKKKALIITSAHKPFNKLKKKIGKNYFKKDLSNSK